MLRVKLRHLDDCNEARRAHAARYRELLEPDIRVVEERPESPSVHHLFAVRFDDRDSVAAELRRHGIETGVHYAPAIHGHEAWEGSPLRHGELPAAEAWAAEELSLPMHPDLEPEEIERVADAVYVAVDARPADQGGQRS